MGRSWTSAENAVIRSHYPTIGSKGCAELLPGRTRGAICYQAGKLGVAAEHRGFPYKHDHLWPFAEALYVAGVAPERIAVETGIPLHTIYGYVTRTGLYEVREMAMADRIAELRAEYERRAA